MSFLVGCSYHPPGAPRLEIASDWTETAFDNQGAPGDVDDVQALDPN